MRAIALVVAGVLSLAPDVSVTGLDHVPIAVRDLGRAADDYRALGFALKPGRAHEDGIQNQHVKFPDGTELELITAPEARDALTTTYRRHLERGDGPVFLALFAPDLAAADERLSALKIPHARNGGVIDFPGEADLGYMFVAGRNKSPTDLPEHFAHPNTAVSLIRVWLAGDDLSRERQLLEGLGATIVEQQIATPQVTLVSVARLREGEVLLLPRSPQLLPERRVVGATLRVGNLDTARAILARGEPPPDIVRTAGGRSVFLPPSRTHGLWLELLEPVRRPQVRHH